MRSGIKKLEVCYFWLEQPVTEIFLESYKMITQYQKLTVDDFIAHIGGSHYFQTSSQ